MYNLFDNLSTLKVNAQFTMLKYIAITLMINLHIMILCKSWYYPRVESWCRGGQFPGYKGCSQNKSCGQQSQGTSTGSLQLFQGASNECLCRHLDVCAAIQMRLVERNFTWILKNPTWIRRWSQSSVGWWLPFDLSKYAKGDSHILPTTEMKSIYKCWFY